MRETTPPRSNPPQPLFPFRQGMGGAMDLVASGSRVIVTMEHCDRRGNPKIMRNCSLPLTGWRVVSKIITEKAVFDVLPHGNGLLLREYGEGETVESIAAVTGCDFTVADDLKEMVLSPKRMA